MTARPSSTRTRRWLVALAVIALSTGFVSMEAYAAWNPTDARSVSVTSGVMQLAFGLDRLTIDANDMAPGGEVLRAVDLDVSGTRQPESPTLTTVATTSSLLDTDTANGLQVSIQVCSQAWDETLTAGVPTAYSCAGSTSTVLDPSQVIVAAAPLQNVDLTLGATNHLLIHLLLPDTAPDAMQGLSSTIQFTFGAWQPAPSFR